MNDLYSNDPRLLYEDIAERAIKLYGLFLGEWGMTPTEAMRRAVEEAGEWAEGQTAEDGTDE